MRWALAFALLLFCSLAVLFSCTLAELTDNNDGVDEHSEVAHLALKAATLSNLGREDDQ